MSPRPTPFPQATYPITDEKGVLTQPWLQFLLALWTRTGGSIPDTPTDSAIISLLMGVQSDETSVSKSDDRSVTALLQSAAILPEKRVVTPIPQEPVAPKDHRRYIQPFFPQDTARRTLNDLAATVPPTEDKNAVRNAFVMEFTPKTGEGDVARSWTVKAVTVGASPFTYIAPSNGVVIVTGGTVSAVTYSRDGTTFLSVGFTAGIIPVRKKDQVRITYTVAPTANFVPM